MTVPWLPASALPTAAAEPFTAETTSAEVGSSASLSATASVMTLPLGFTPGVPLLRPPASVASAVFGLATGGVSGATWMVDVAVLLSSVPSFTTTVMVRSPGSLHPLANTTWRSAVW